MAAHSAGWRNAKHAAQWTATLSTYAYPHIGETPAGEIDTNAVVEVLRPIWNDKTETASRIRQRIEVVLDAARAQGAPVGENPARWRGHLDKLLPKPSNVRAVRHHSALPFDRVPALYAALRTQVSVSADALAFLILTATRSGEARGALWPEINIDKAEWVIPPERMKQFRSHRVPLSDEAVAVLRKRLESRMWGEAFVFPGSGDDKPISDTAVRKCLHAAVLDGSAATVHGLRSSFRDWAAEETRFPRELAEVALSHTVGDETERSYQRGDLLAKRRQMMNAWARYCASPMRRGKVGPAQHGLSVSDQQIAIDTSGIEERLE